MYARPIVHGREIVFGDVMSSMTEVGIVGILDEVFSKRGSIENNIRDTELGLGSWGEQLLGVCPMKEKSILNKILGGLLLH